MPEETMPLEKAREYIEMAQAATAKLYFAFAKELVESLGEEEGIKVLRRAVHRFGTLRGKMIRERLDAAGVEPTVANLSKFYDLPIAVSQVAEVIRKEENYLEKKAFSCATGRTLRTLGPEAVRLGVYYCEQDKSLREAFNENFSYEQLSNALAGDDCCHSILKLKE